MTRRTATISTLDAACVYVRRGWSVVPIPLREKGPRLRDWNSLRLREMDLSEHFCHAVNIGLILGDASGGLVDVDVDAREGLCAATHLLPSTDLVHGRPGKPSSHFWYVAPGTASRRFTDLDGSMLIEVRSTGLQTLVPPSVHPTGEVLVWEREGPPAAVDASALSDAVARVAVVALIARHWPQPGSRHDAANALAGMLLRANWNEVEAQLFIRNVAQAAGDEETRSRVADVVTTANRIATGQPATGAPTLAKILGDQIINRIREWLKLHVPIHLAVVDSSILASEIRRIVLTKEIVAFDKRRDIQRLIRAELQAKGEFFRTPDDRGFYFHTGERRLFDVEQMPFQRMVADLSGLSATETHFKFTLDVLQTFTLRTARVVEVHTFSHYDVSTGSIAVSDGGPAIWVRHLNEGWRELKNGDNGLFFLTDADATPWTPDFTNRDEALERWLSWFLFSTDGLPLTDARALVQLWTLHQFFPPLRRTRMIPCFLGGQGSGKTTAMRLIGRLFVGPSFDVSGVQRDREDAVVAAVTNRIVLGLDNVDSKIPWLPDSLAL